MRVVLNGLAALKPKTGVGHHVADLFAALVAHPAADVTLYPGRILSRTAARLRKPAKPSPRAESQSWLRTAAVSAARVAARGHFAAFTRCFRFDLYHEPNFVPFPCHLPTVVTVHDLSVLKFPHWHPADRVKQHQRHFLRGLGRAGHVIAVSEAIRRELIDELNCPPHRVSTVHNGVGRQYVPQPESEVLRVRAKYDLPPKFFLCVGTIEPRKNLVTAITAFAGLPAAVREACPLVLAGPWGWRSEAEHEAFDRVGHAAGVRHVGYVPADDLPAVYAAARCLVYPSHYEGFGFPPVEMLAVGGAVLASTDAAVREVVGGCAAFIDAGDSGGWHDAMLTAATDDEFIAGLRTGGPAQAARYTWERAADETAGVYRTTLGSETSPSR